MENDELDEGEVDDDDSDEISDELKSTILVSLCFHNFLKEIVFKNPEIFEYICHVIIIF